MVLGVKRWLFKLLQKPKNQAVLLLCFVLIWYLQVRYASTSDYPTDLIELALWSTSCILKILVLATLPIGLGAAYDSIRARPKKAIVAGLVWIGAGLLLVTTLSVYRETWAQPFSIATYYSVGTPMLYGGEIVTHYSAWLSDWQSGEVVLIESLLVVSLALGHASIGYWYRGTSASAIVHGYLLSFVLLVTYVFLSGWVLMDYDFFHGDSFPSAVLFDHLFFPLASHPYTSIASVIYVACFISNVFIVYLSSPTARS